MPADNIDHIPPRSDRARLIGLGLADRFEFIEVPSCRECNSLLGARSLWTVEERGAFIKEALAKRYKKLRKIPDWDRGELSEMEGNFQDFVFSGLVARDVLRTRLEWPVGLRERG